MGRLAVTALVLVLAGCAGTAPEENVGTEEPAPCGRTYVMMQFAGTPEDDALWRALEAAGYRWERQGPRAAGLWPLGSETVNGTIVREPGISGDDLLISVQERLEGDHEDSVRAVARDLGENVNQTYPDARLTRWAEGVHTAGCGRAIV